MIVGDVGKMAGLATITLGIILLVAIGRMSWNDGLPVITLIVGYLTGNGVSAVRKSAPSPVVMPNVQPGEMATIHGPVTADIPGGGPAAAEPGEQRFHTDENGSL